MWFIFALLSAVFAAFTAIFAKIGIEGVDSHLATAIRTFIVLIMAWGMVFLLGTHSGIDQISKKSWIFLVFSGLATGASWLCYYKAISLGEVSRVASVDKLSVVITIVLGYVLLGETFNAKTAIAAALITIGAILMAL